jgi:hypothetical protein
VEQAHRFDRKWVGTLPPHLNAVSILGVDYICGPAQSTGGYLWVVGRDPRLFDYFLPERWRQTPHTPLSPVDPVYRTVTKDNIQLVWRKSRVGAQPAVDASHPAHEAIRKHGYNSPFEEVALSIDLQRRCIPATYPRAIYMTGQEGRRAAPAPDERRFETHKDLLTPEGAPILRRDREYLTVWGYWNKPDEMLAVADRDHYRAMDALQALRDGTLSDRTYQDLMRSARARLRRCDVEDLDFGGAHILISIDYRGAIIKGRNGLPEPRVCNFELLKRREPGRRPRSRGPDPDRAGFGGRRP